MSELSKYAEAISDADAARIFAERRAAADDLSGPCYGCGVCDPAIAAAEEEANNAFWLEEAQREAELERRVEEAAYLRDLSR